MGEPANLGQGAVMGFSRGQLPGGPGPRRHDLNKRQVEGGSTQHRQPLEVGLPGAVGPLVAVPMWRQSALVQPPLELVDVGQAAPGDGVGHPGESGIGQTPLRQRDDHRRLS